VCVRVCVCVCALSAYCWLILTLWIAVIYNSCKCVAVYCSALHDAPFITAESCHTNHSCCNQTIHVAHEKVTSRMSHHIWSCKIQMNCVIWVSSGWVISKNKSKVISHMVAMKKSSWPVPLFAPPAVPAALAGSSFVGCSAALVYINVCVYIHTYIYMNENVYTYMYIYTCICIHVYIYIYIYRLCFCRM